jgi:hypothetical protein
MESMSSVGRHEKAFYSLQAQLEEWKGQAASDDGDGPDCYGIGHELVSTLTLAGGGPSTWIEYNHSEGRAVYVTTAPDYANRGTAAPDRVELTADESDLVAQWFGLDYVEGLTIEPDGTVSR